jgi:hypothetical protein
MQYHADRGEISVAAEYLVKPGRAADIDLHFDAGRKVPRTAFAQLVSASDGVSLFHDAVPGGVWLRLDGVYELPNGAMFRVGKQVLRYERGHLQAVDGGCGVGLKVAMTRGAMVIGRRTADIVFPDDPQVSGTHARVTPAGDRARLEDLGSTNGTFVYLHTGSHIPIGALFLLGETVYRTELAS